MEKCKAGGMTPLLRWSDFGYALGARMLIDANANLEHRTDDGMTAVHLAARGGHAELVALLAEAGVPLDVQDVRGMTPLMLAAEQNKEDLVKTLLAHSADMANGDTRGRTALMLACQNGHLPVTELLLSRGAASCFVDLFGQPPLWIAAENGHSAVVRFLLLAAADPNALRRSDGASPLWIAVAQGHIAVAKLLLESGAEPNAALQVAAQTVFLLSMEGHGIDGVEEMDLVTPLCISPDKSLIAVAVGEKVGLLEFDSHRVLLFFSVPGVVDFATFHPSRYVLMIKIENTILALNLETKHWHGIGEFETDDDYPKLPWPRPALGPSKSMWQLDGATPLWIAAACGRLEMVELLLRHGANQTCALTFPPHAGTTPLQALQDRKWHAQHQGKVAAIAQLLS